MNTLFKNLSVCALVMLVIQSKALAQTTEQLQKIEQLKAVLGEAEKQGLHNKWYMTAAVDVQVASSFATRDLVMTEKIVLQLLEQIAVDLNRGRVLPDTMVSLVKIPARAVSKMDVVQSYLQRQISASEFVSRSVTKNPMYARQLVVLNRLKTLRDSGQWMTLPKTTKWVAVKVGMNDSVLVNYLRHKLYELGYSVVLNSSSFDSDLEKVVRQYQDDHALEVDGVIGSQGWAHINRDINQLITQAIINLDRSRWLPEQLESERVYVNLAAQKLSYYQNNIETLNFKTINGRVDRKTPLMIDSIKHVVLNPTWTVPFSIFIKDKLPVLQKDPGYIARLNMSVIDDLTGKEVDPYSIDWNSQNAQNVQYTLIQKPGPWNALGFIKFPLNNPYSIYLHDTDSRPLFDKSARLLSSGCVRLQKPFDLGEKILNSPEWTVDSLKKATEFRATIATDSTWLKVKRFIPVYLFYQTAFAAEDGRMVLVADNYGIDKITYAKMIAK